MIFLIEYNRPEGRIVTMRQFSDKDREVAQESRFALELERNQQGVNTEIVILEAASEEALHKTHGRYFESLQQLLQSTIVQMKNLH